MQIETLEIRNVTSLVEVALDFRTLEPGIIAVVGPNGAGKTTLIESMIGALYGVMPSRSRVRLPDLVHGARDASIAVDVCLGGIRYRGQTQLDGYRRTRQAVLSIGDDAGDWRTITNGKATDYDAAVRERFPALEVLLASAFGAQDRGGSFATASRAERKAIFTRLLGLDRYDQWAEAGKSGAALAVRRRETLEAQAAAWRQSADRVEAIRGNLAELAAESGRVAEAFVTARDALAAAEARLAEARNQAAHLAASRQAVDTAAADLEAAKAELVAARRRRLEVIELQADELRSAEAGADMALDRLRRDEEAIPSDDQVRARHEATRARQEAASGRAGRRSRLAASIRDREALEASRDAVAAAQRVLEAALAEAQAAQAALVARSEAYWQADRTLAEARQARDQARATVEHAERLDRAAALLSTVPFGERCLEAACGFVADAGRARTEREALGDVAAGLEQAETRLRDAEARATEARTNRDDARDREAAATREVPVNQAEIRVQAARLLTNGDELDRDRQALAALEDEQERADVEAANVLDESLKAAGAARTMIAGEIAAAEAHRAELAPTIGRRYADVLAEREAAEESAGVRVEDTARTLATVRAKIATLGTVDTQIATGEREVAGLRTTLESLTADAVRLSERETSSREALALGEAAQARVSGLASAVETLDAEAREWGIVADMFGPSGLRLLEIDAAGPAVTAFANDLLEACFGGRFSVELITQEARASGKGEKDTFAIRVIDGTAPDESRDLADLSGGEQVIVDEALKSAIALYANQRTGTPIETCWRDETAGALRPETAARYWTMLRRIRERGGFRHMFVVVHQPELAVQADYQVIVAEGSARLVAAPFPPFVG